MQTCTEPPSICSIKKQKNTIFRIFNCAEFLKFVLIFEIKVSNIFIITLFSEIQGLMFFLSDAICEIKTMVIISFLCKF